MPSSIKKATSNHQNFNIYNSFTLCFRLVPGVLQLPEGSHLMVDETRLESGSLNSTGIENTKLLKNLIEFQKVSCALFIGKCVHIRF